MQHLGGADPIEDRLAGLACPFLENRRWQSLTNRHSEPQRGKVRALVHCTDHGAISPRRSKADRCLIGLDDFDDVGGRCVFRQGGGCPEPQREDRKAAKAECESERRRANKDVTLRHLQYFARISIGDDQKIAMEMHCPLGLAGGAGSESEQGHVITPSVNSVKFDRFIQRNSIELGIMVGSAVEGDNLLEEPAVFSTSHQFVSDAAIAQTELDLCLVDYLAELARAQQWHSVHHDRTGLAGP